MEFWQLFSSLKKFVSWVKELIPQESIIRFFILYAIDALRCQTGSRSGFAGRVFCSRIPDTVAVSAHSKS